MKVLPSTRVDSRLSAYTLGSTHDSGRIISVAVLLRPFWQNVEKVRQTILLTFGRREADMIAIIDYGMGNLRSVHKAFEAVGHQAVVTRDPRVIGSASHVVLPGVGAFGDCMANLESYDLIDPIRRSVAAGKPFLGICLGLQMLFTESEEFGLHKGLDIIPGRVKRFAFPLNPELKIPHMGWNAVTPVRPAPPLAGVGPDTFAYFVHSYYVEPTDAGVESSVTDYGIRFVSSIWQENIFACQFHPEKSQTIGLKIVKNFGDWT